MIYEKIITEAQQADQPHYSSSKIAELTDLTLLNEEALEEDHIELCQKANLYQVPAICVYSQWLAFCRKYLNTNIKIATVANFPKANYNNQELLAELQQILELKPSEIDIVFPYEDYLQGETKKALNKMLICRDFIPESVKLKVIIETEHLII